MQVAGSHPGAKLDKLECVLVDLPRKNLPGETVCTNASQVLHCGLLLVNLPLH